MKSKRRRKERTWSMRQIKQAWNHSIYGNAWSGQVGGFDLILGSKFRRRLLAQKKTRKYKGK